MSARSGGNGDAEATVKMRPMPEGTEVEKIRIALPDWGEHPGSGGVPAPDMARFLTLSKTGRLERTTRQRAALARKDGWPNTDPLFGADLNWSCYRCALNEGGAGWYADIFLFTVIVALEWRPSERYLRQLRRGLTQASNLLYDVTNGQMGFGKVIIADESWMDCADIQVMASNRLLPRSWTAGLIQHAKYAPVRVGRGVRVRDRREILGWDEADAYHTLIHEWLHYALGLRDLYIADPREYRNRPASGAVAARLAEAQATGPVSLVLPISGHGNNSIMSTPVGNSELFAQAPDDEDGAQYYRGSLGEVPYPGFNPAIGRRDPGPYQLPLPMPIFRLAGAFHPSREENRTLVEVIRLPDSQRLGNVSATEVELDLSPVAHSPFKPFHIEDPGSFTRWDVAIVTGNPDDGDARVVAQGFIDATALSDATRSFDLLEATQGAQVLVIGNPADAQGSRMATYLGEASGKPGLLPFQQGQVPADRPFVDVFVDTTRTCDDIRDVAVRPEADDECWEPTLLPHGRQGNAPSALEGQILVRGADGTQLVCSYSRGGVPPTIGNTPTNPISAGSSDGGALIFGHADKIRDPEAFAEASRTIVVTTSIPWLPNDRPQLNVPNFGVLDPQTVRPLSNVFSITSNRPFADLTRRGHTLHPTLVIFYEAAALHPGESPLLCRHVEDKTERNSWAPVRMATAQSLLAAIALNEASAPCLYDGRGGKLVDRYCLFAVEDEYGALGEVFSSLSPDDPDVNAPGSSEAARAE